SSTTTPPRTTAPTSTGSAAPAGPGPPGSRAPSWPGATSTTATRPPARPRRAGAAGAAPTFVALNELDTADLIRRRLELTDEPVPEIYSTSPLLRQLFHLPTMQDDTATSAAAAPG